MSEELPPEVHKTYGPPGTGKTTEIIGNPELGLEGLFVENLEEYDFDEQMFVTYTNAGVDEAVDRLRDLTNLYKYQIEERVTTIHSRCFQTLDLDPKQVVRRNHKKKFCNTFDLEFGYEDDEGDIMTAELDEGHSLFRIYEWLANNRKALESWEDCPAEWQGDDDIVMLMNEWEQFKADRNLLQFSDMIEEVIIQGRRQVENRGLGVLFPDEDTTDMEMFEVARRDTHRCPEDMRGEGAFIDTKVLYIDESQDLTRLQFEWYLLQKLVADTVYIAADPNQCLPPNAPVTVKSAGFHDSNPESEQKPIKDVKIGDRVRSMKSDGEYEYKPVSNITKRDVDDKRFRIIKTESGKLTAVTDNHRMFARIPAQEYEQNIDKEYVYLMKDRDDNWRIGITTDLRQRLNVEAGSRCIIPLDSFESREEALLMEEVWSLKYSIPTINIADRSEEGVMEEDSMREKLYNNLEVDLDGISDDLGIYPEHPPLYKKATNLGRTSSVNINIKMCSDVRRNYYHELVVYTSNNEAICELRRINKLNEQDGRKDSKKFSKQSQDLNELGNIAEKVQQKTGGDIITYMSPTEERSRAIVTPAGNLIEGMLVPVVSDDAAEVVWEEIKDIKDKNETTEVYDLTVSDTHNFDTSGIFVHNTIYGWSGADPRFVLDEEGDERILDRTYRLPENIWDVSKGVIDQCKDKVDVSGVEPDGEGGDVVLMRNPSKLKLARHLEGDESVFVLFRARYMIDEFNDDILHKYGIPYENMSTYPTWQNYVVKLRDALATLYKGEKLNGSEFKTLKEYYDKEVSNSTMDNIGGISSEKAVEIIGLSSSAPVVTYLNNVDGDEINYFQEKAIRNNIKRENYDMQPERVKVGTMHSAKGKEAETVLVATDSTKRILANMERDTESGQLISDAERRVLYVAMTRASEKLVMAEGVIDEMHSLPLERLLGDTETESQKDGLAELAQ